ncbi:ornithine cyclodeaminase [Haloactinopolyspora alba]|uniref:Ornithine cyclodeaminase n=1 Tax=Haloactinopolyspora alba TaxID=648780 RepID=A0A2P8EG04_9ACTN|nr:ornithine cyclodeaminase family protein [Haloactinopolyspora alba]PSL08374.1 ornithine cyclodeaminase [Haloactinopolyspora alba]
MTAAGPTVPGPTRVLTRSDLLAVLDPQVCVTALRDGFRSDASPPVPARKVSAELPFAGSAVALVPGVLPGIDAYTVKVNAKFPASAPALRGVICLHGSDGRLLALLDSGTVTAWRTGLAAALATDALSVDDPDGQATLGVVGAGAQAELVLRGLRGMRRFAGLAVYDSDPARADAFAARHGGNVYESPARVAAVADIVVLATWSRSPLLHLADTVPGQHLTSLGADEAGKQELGPDLLESALLVVDDRDLAATAGVLASSGLAPSTLDTTVGTVLCGGHPGRTAADQRTVYAPVGLPWQDLALAWEAYVQAEQRGVGATVDLLS